MEFVIQFFLEVARKDWHCIDKDWHRERLIHLCKLFSQSKLGLKTAMI